ARRAAQTPAAERTAARARSHQAERGRRAVQLSRAAADPSRSPWPGPRPAISFGYQASRRITAIGAAPAAAKISPSAPLFQVSPAAPLSGLSGSPSPPAGRPAVTNRQSIP